MLFTFFARHVSGRVVALLLACLVALLPASVLAKDESSRVLLLVSQRNAELVAAAAHEMATRHPNVSLQARSDQQLLQMSSQEWQALWQESDIVAGAGLFGPVVNELTAFWDANPDLVHAKPTLMFNSDHRVIGLSSLNRQPVFTNPEQVQDHAKQRPSDPVDEWVKQRENQFPELAPWTRARGYWQAGGVDNLVSMITYLASFNHPQPEVADIEPLPRLSWRYQGKTYLDAPPLLANNAHVVIVDHPQSERPGDATLLEQFCQLFQQGNLDCVIAMAGWGEPTVNAIETLANWQQQQGNISSIVMLQDFVMGGGEGREQVTELLKTVNTPVINAMRMRDRTLAERQISADGMAADKVYYQVSMPEIQGASQPIVVANAGELTTDSLSGILVQPIYPDEAGVKQVADRARRWHTLRSQSNFDKKVAVIYYNHPPGRHNIGADNLDVPATLWTLLQNLKAQGYDTGELPKSQTDLLDQLQEKGINLPNDHQALADMAPNIARITLAGYQAYFESLPTGIQQEMVFGPFGFLEHQVRLALEAKKPQLAQDNLRHTMEELTHLLEGVDHRGRRRALALLAELNSTYQQLIALPRDSGHRDSDQNVSDQRMSLWTQIQQLVDGIQATGIEGIQGWGKAPGNVMVYDNELLLPGLQFGKIFLGPQPPRGWEVNEELLHANLAFPPPHQYLAFYHYLRDEFKADAYVHIGRHSTYEFLPRRSVGLLEDDYANLIASDVPNIYPYIVDGVGEGIQAKRRGLAVMVDHLTPPLKHTALYDELLQLRQLIESYESHHGNDESALSNQLIEQIRTKVDSLELKDELAESMSAELAIMGIGFDEVDDDMLVHEIGHYLTQLQEKFMPLGLHVFGRQWETNAVTMMIDSMQPPTQAESAQWQANLERSPDAEMAALLGGLSGQFVAPGKGNDPIRSPDSLPTGRNFYALDNSLIPSKVAWNLGQTMAKNARSANQQSPDKREAVILWASDVVRDEGVMVAFGLDMLGLKPVWNSRGIIKGLERRPLASGEIRRDVVFTTSGLFRDLYANQMYLLDNAVLMALDASANRIYQDYPALTLALQTALAPLGELANSGDEPLSQNQVAAHWVEDAQALLAKGWPALQVGSAATTRIFGDAPGGYGAGINRMVERSGAWQQREELAAVYLRRLGHGYSQQQFGVPAHEVFERNLSQVENSYFGRSSNLYGLIDNNDAFDYLGGLSLAVETLSGQAPNNYVLDHSDPTNITTQPLGLALKQELRGRFLNPEWLQGLMKHDYAGARTMGSEFLEYLWGWQVTNPSLVGDWAWEEVKDVYLDDRYDIGLDDFLAQGHNVHVKTNMLAIMLVAIHKGFWQADDATQKELAADFADLVTQHGLPGSGHTKPDHPMLQSLETVLPKDKWQALSGVLDAAKAPEQAKPVPVTRLQEVSLTDANQQPIQDPIQEPIQEPKATENTEIGVNDTASDDENTRGENTSSNANTDDSESSNDREANTPNFFLPIGALLLLVLLISFWRSWRTPPPIQKEKRP